jgi:hypothetical protein
MVPKVSEDTLDKGSGVRILFPAAKMCGVSIALVCYVAQLQIRFFFVNQEQQRMTDNQFDIIPILQLSTAVKFNTPGNAHLPYAYAFHALPYRPTRLP